MLNMLDIIFLVLSFEFNIVGWLILHFERYLPIFVLKGFKYGSIGHRGKGADFLKAIEIPKSYFKHFYAFAFVFSIIVWLYTYSLYYLGFSASKYVAIILKMIFREDEPSVSASAAFIAISLLTMQCIRRFYETHYMQVFSKALKMNVIHYCYGYIHYFATIIAVVAQAPLFCGDLNTENIVWNDTWTKLFYVPCIAVFMWAWYEQYQTNVIFVNLRKDKRSGKVTTESHAIPHGRLFTYVSSPHRTCECILYIVLYILVPTTTVFCICLWVLSNQIQISILTHEWYKKTFENYPKNRKAVIPHLV